MKLYLPCIECQIERGIPSFEFTAIELNDKGYYELTCSKGHNTIILLQNTKFEVLFEMGANAILDGHYREAISSFTASLERFYEYCIELFTYSNNIDETVYKNTWKLISNQSERQFGAFCCLYMLEFKEVAIDNKINEDLRKYRNKVIHQGYIPAKEEAIKYGDTIFNLINPMIKNLKQKYKEAIPKLGLKRLKEIHNNCSKDRLYPSMCINTILSLAYEDNKRFENKSFSDILNSLKKQNDMLKILKSPLTEKF